MMPQVVILTGASSGIGEATALSLIEAGFDVYGGARRVERMAGLAQRGATVAELDVTDERSMVAFVDRVLGDRGRVHVLINNAGYGSYGSVEEVPLDEGRRQLDVNLFGLTRMTQLVTPSMRAAGSGRIVNTSSMGGHFGEALGAWYHASQFAVEGFSDSLRLELHEFGIRVILIEPGPIRTEWGDGAYDSAQKYSGTGAYVRQVRAMKALYAQAYRRGAEAAVIAEVIRDAVTSKRPKARYAAPFSARAIIAAAAVLPDRVLDAGQLRSISRLARSLSPFPSPKTADRLRLSGLIPSNLSALFIHRWARKPAPVHSARNRRSFRTHGQHALDMIAPLTPQAPFRGHSRQRRWDRVSYGLYAPSRVRTLAEELHAWQLVLPRTAAFSHLTAAALRGWWLPAPIVHPIFAAVTTTSHGVERTGLLMSRHPQPVVMHLIDGLRVTTPGETLLAAARDLGVLDLVVLGDSALRMRHCTLTELAMTARQHRRGAPLLRTVLPLLNPRSESPWESIMRVLHRAAEIPVTPQQELFDEFGRFIARADLLIDGTPRLHEYDGAVHRDGDVHESDLNRDRALISAKFERYGFTSRQLLQGGAGIIADVDRLLGRPWNPRRLAAWNCLIEHSLYGRTGRARAYQHWRRAQA